MAEESLKRLHFTKCFLGADGFVPPHGFTTTDFFTARLNEIALENSEKKYILIDSSKFFTSSTVSFTNNTKIDSVITESQPQPDLLDTTNFTFSIITDKE